MQKSMPQNISWRKTASRFLQSWSYTSANHAMPQPQHSNCADDATQNQKSTGCFLPNLILHNPGTIWDMGTDRVLPNVPFGADRVFTNVIPPLRREKDPIYSKIENHRIERWEWVGADLNRRHTDFQSVALPTELPTRYARSTAPISPPIKRENGGLHIT